MRILSLCTDYPPNLGGIAALSSATNRELAALGHEVRVIASCADPLAAREFDGRQPFPTRRVPARLGVRELSLYAALGQELGSFEPEVVWSATWYPGAVAASFGSLKALLSFSAYGSEIWVNQAGWTQRLKARLGPLRRRVFEAADPIFALSRYTRSRLITMGAPAHKVQVLPGGVGEEWFALQARQRGPDDPWVMLTVARLEDYKGHDTVIRALPRIRSRVPKVRYELVGPDGGDWARLESLARSLEVSDLVRYRGVLSGEDLRQAYQQADIFVMASREGIQRPDLVEGFGLVFLEAAAVGLPSLAGNSGGVADAVEHEVSGLLVDPHSSEALAEAALRLMENQDYARHLGQRGRERAHRSFTWRAVTTRMVQCLEEALARRASP